MKKGLLIAGALAALGAAPLAHAANYSVFERFYEPDTQPNDSIFKGTFDYDSATHAVTNLKGMLSESMTGNNVGYPNDSMTWLSLENQLVSWYDAALHGTFAATFLKSTTSTFTTAAGGDGWSPQSGVDNGGVYSGWPSRYSKSVQNAYALIFVPDDPLSALTQAQIDKLAYADCAPGGMMGAVCMTATSVAGYGAIGTMSGYPVEQRIALLSTPTPPVPEPETYAMMMAGLGLMGAVARRRRGTALSPCQEAR